MSEQLLPAGLADPNESGPRLRKIVDLLTEARDLVGGMPLSSRHAALHVQVYAALAVARAVEQDGRP